MRRSISERLRSAAPAAPGSLGAGLAAGGLGFLALGGGAAGLGALALGLLGGAVHLAGEAAGAVPGWFRRTRPDPRFAAWDPGIAALGARTAPLRPADLDALTGYIAAGVEAYRSPGCARILPPGLPSTAGIAAEGLEGFARSGALLAAWVAHRGARIALPDGTRFDALGHLAQGLAAGTDPRSREYWGPIGDRDQRMVEAADIALIVWLLREELAAALPPASRDALLAWLGTAAGRETWGSNWELYPVMASLAREAWGCAPDPDKVLRYRIAEHLDLGGGWYDENVAGRVDHYTAWAMHHALTLIARMDPVLDAGRAERGLRAFAPGFLRFFGPAGAPMFGRSLTYRLATPTPLIHAVALAAPPITPGEAWRALDATWRHFLARGALRHGTVTQGLAGPGPRAEIVENYMGRSSALWSLRPLVALYMRPPSAPLWQATPEPLPVELGSYTLELPEPRLTVIGDHASGVVEVRHHRNAGLPPAPVLPQAVWQRAAEALLRRPMRPSNFAAKYQRPAYRTDEPL